MSIETNHPQRKPSIKSRRSTVTEDILRAVMCGASSELEIEELTGAPHSQVVEVLIQLEAQGKIVCVDSTAPIYVPAQSLRRAG